MASNKQIVFTSRKIPNSAFTMRGEQIINELCLMGYDAKIVPPDKITEIKESIIIWVRRSTANELKICSQNNYQILDPLDRINDLNSPSAFTFFGCHKYFNAIIFPSKSQLNYYNNDKRYDGIKKYWVHHHYDPYLKYYEHDHFEIGYWGYSTSAVNIRIIKGKNRYNTARAGQYPPDDFFQRVSCHYNVRDYKHGLGWRPTTKISTAAACGANIITSRDAMSVELLPHNYPYFLDNCDHENIERMIQYASQTYGNEIWNYGLSCMARVRKFTSVNYCAKMYGKIINDIIENHF